MAYKIAFNPITGKFDLVNTITGAVITNNITPGGTTDEVADFSVELKQAAAGSDTFAATDVPSRAHIEEGMAVIRDDLYQLTQKVNEILNNN